MSRLDIPIDASPSYRARCERIKQAIETHGSHNTYYLYNARCTFHLTNDELLGMLEYRFEGTVLTDASDQKTQHCDLNVELVREDCDWLTAPIVAWFMESVRRAVALEFDRYIAAGDLAITLQLGISPGHLKDRPLVPFLHASRALVTSLKDAARA